MKSGFVSIVGRPNVGKSTLLNKLLNQKIAITSDKVGTTRNTIYGIYNDEDSQIVFVDTPGINKATSKLGEVLNNKAYSSFDNDLVLFLVDIASGYGPNDNKILNRLKEDNKDVILVLTKVDKIKKIPILCIDDIGAEAVTPWGRDEVLCSILQYRMQSSLPTFFTSNLDIKALEQHFSITHDGVEELKSRRVIERILQLTDDIEMVSANLRK